MNKWPKHLGNKKAFMSLKRKQYNAAMRAINDLRWGCAFLPGALPNLMEATRLLRDLMDHRKDWR